MGDGFMVAFQSAKKALDCAVAIQRAFDGHNADHGEHVKVRIGLHAVRARERELQLTATFLTGVLGFTDYGEEDGWHRYGVNGGGSGKHIELRSTPDATRGAW